MTQRALAQLLADDAQQHAAEREHHFRLRLLEQGAAPVWQAQQAAERDRSCEKTERRRLRRLAARQGPERKVTEKDSWASHLGEPALRRAAATAAAATAAHAATSGTLPTGLGARKQGDPARVKNVEGLVVVAPAAATRYVVVGRHQSDVEVIKETCQLRGAVEVRHARAEARAELLQQRGRESRSRLVRREVRPAAAPRRRCVRRTRRQRRAAVPFEQGCLDPLQREVECGVGLEPLKLGPPAGLPFRQERGVPAEGGEASRVGACHEQPRGGAEARRLEEGANRSRVDGGALRKVEDEIAELELLTVVAAAAEAAQVLVNNLDQRRARAEVEHAEEVHNQRRRADGVEQPRVLRRPRHVRALERRGRGLQHAGVGRVLEHEESGGEEDPEEHRRCHANGRRGGDMQQHEGEVGRREAHPSIGESVGEEVEAVVRDDGGEGDGREGSDGPQTRGEQQERQERASGREVQAARGAEGVRGRRHGVVWCRRHAEGRREELRRPHRPQLFIDVEAPGEAPPAREGESRDACERCVRENQR
mmetsp:Transcript_9062/g.28678  ORF Transcript_9062/g.28678 Transcript_9062/m.28678 type:complete len:538 (-) Transcript_9062:1077-2690(-)